MVHKVRYRRPDNQVLTKPRKSLVSRRPGVNGAPDDSDAVGPEFWRFFVCAESRT